MAATALTGDPQRIVSDILSYSFWDILDLRATFSSSMKNMKEQHNNLLPTRKGRIRSPEYTTAKIIIHLLAHEMEDARKNRPELYKIYMSDEVDSMPVHTNRGQLRTLMDEEYGLSSFSNFINRLLDSGIIVHKRNTSSVMEKVVDPDGTVRKRVKMMQGGRGDFILYVNKKALTFFTPNQELWKRESDPKIVINKDISEEDQSIENQRVTSAQIQSLEQPRDTLEETRRINKNKRGNVENVAAKPRIMSAFAQKIFENGDGEGKFAYKGSSGAATPEAQIYVENFEKDRRINCRLPENDKEFYCKLLFSQLSQTVYPEYTEEYIVHIESPVKNLLRLHLQRLDLPIDEAFQQVSRAIHLTSRYLKTHPESYIYAPLTWLRIDDEMKTGSLKKVVDEWIPREEKRLLVYKKEMNGFVKWQYAVRYSDKVFLEVIKGLKKSFNLGLRMTKEALKKLDALFEKYDLPKNVRTTLRKRFSDRTYAILQELNKLGEEPEDPTLKAFEQYQKLTQKTG